jgi:hypothetical protein
LNKHFELQSTFKNKDMKPFLLFTHFCAAALFTLQAALMYISVQQQYRKTANDPQVQLAEDLAQKLERGKPVEKLFPADTVDLSRSLGLFAVFYNEAGQPVRSSAILDGRPPRLPAGVFAFTKAYGEDRVSWQPRKDVRMAMVIVRTATSTVAYVATGRSLNEVEDREASLAKILVIGWTLCMSVIVFHLLVQAWLNRKPLLKNP